MESERSPPEWEKPVNGPITHKEGDPSEPRELGKSPEAASLRLQIDIEQVR